ncbi:MAG: nucleotide-binding protein [Candidatus Loosdrechtia sp.]|uniref:nucleotide-binding protein n=1 Tax=Candidatus Loosdrechtia sp. TaxID=3101272 RepID=UPI003A6C0B3D|nr:MAG: AAA family ATPase [Candidatus Jettenia sp. AMX2]
MAFNIAVAGKGGTGKSTLSALIIRYITEELGKPVSAVDADPNASLGTLLGLQIKNTVADIREDIVEKKVDFSGMSKDRYIEYAIEESIIETTKFDLLTMGRPEGPKCYCYVNNLLRKYLDKVGTTYPFIVTDNEAGMEHLSRRTTNNVDLLIIVSEPTIVGALTMERILKLAESLPVTIRQKACVLNRVPVNGIHENLQQKLYSIGIEVSAIFPFNTEIYDTAACGASVFEISRENEVYGKLGKFLQKYLPAGMFDRNTISNR